MKKQTFKTSNFYLASALTALGEKIKDLDRSDPSRVIFIFQDSSTLQKKIEKFRLQKLKIEPQKLFFQQKMLKGLIHKS